MMHVIERLRLAREQRGLDLDALARRTRLRLHLLETVDQGRWHDLPRGMYARAVIRAYAEAVGVDSRDVIAAVEPLLPQAEDPLDGLARVHGFERRPSVAALPLAAPSGAHPPQPDPPVEQPPNHGTTLDWKRLATASAVDGALLAGFVTLLLLGTAALSGSSLSQVLDGASAGIALIAALSLALYFLLLGGIAGATFGERLTGQGEARPAFRGTIPAASRRARAVLLEEGSILVTALLRRGDLAGRGGTRAMDRSGTRWEEPAAAR